MFEDIISEANGMVAERKVLNMILAEKYAIADLNAVKNYERAEGKAEGKAEVVHNLMLDYNLTFEKAAEMIHLSEEECEPVRRFLEKMIQTNA